MKSNGNGFYQSEDPELNQLVEEAREEYRRSQNPYDDPLDPPDGQPITDLGERDFGAENLDPTAIQPREWILGNWFCREFCSSLIGVGAGGKTAFRIACSLAITANRPNIVGENLFDRVPVLYVCFEDSEKELNRRILAAMKYHNVSNADVAGYLFVKTVKRLKFATKEDFKLKIGPLYNMLKAAILRRNVGLVILDPFIKTHSVEENSNTDMDTVAELIGNLANACNVAVDIPQHVRKGSIEPGDAEAGRGASATKDAGRLAYTLCRMSKAEADSFSLPPNEARFLFRIDSAKVNITPDAANAKWFKLVSQNLGNTNVDPRYPNGDSVQTVVPWIPPALFSKQNLPPDQVRQILATLAATPKNFTPDTTDGEKWRRDQRAGPLWVGWPIAKITGKAKGEVKRIVNAWVEAETLTPDTYYSPARKETVDSYILNPTKAADILNNLPKE